MNLYQQEILEHYHHPHNATKPKDYTQSAVEQNLSCGDEISVYLKTANNVLTDMHFQAHGCAISIASASILSDKLVGMSIPDIEKLDLSFVQDTLGIEFTPSRSRCALLPLQAVQKALATNQPEHKID